MKYFTSCTTLEALKKEYRRLCMIHHPDRGGDAATEEIRDLHGSEKIKTRSAAVLTA